MADKVATWPVVIDKTHKPKAMLVVALGGFLLYLLPNHIHLFPPQQLAPTFLDSLIPFLPQSIWIYNSAILLFWTPYLLSEDPDNWNRFLYSYSCLVLISMTIFFLYPTAYPRMQFPLPAGLDPLTQAMFSLTRWIDSPSNCMPSLHVSGAFLSSFLLRSEKSNHGKVPYFYAWAAVVSFSTLTAKQHYVVDVATGFFLALAIHCLFQIQLSRYIQDW